MLSPENRIVLLPQDREIMDITGMSEEEYRWFVRECYKNSKLRPGEPVALEPFAISLILTAVSILLSAAAMLLAPKPKDQEKKTPEEETIEGQNVVRRDRFAPKSGFDSLQNVVDMGSVVPVVYCKRHEKAGITYGGIRVNTNLLWSQVLSVGGGQFFRGIFLVGEAPINLERRQLALGNNTLASYELERFAEAGRISYYFKDGGRIDKDDIDLGVIPANDPGAFNLDDIYEVDDGTKFCQALQPSNQVEFGVYGHIGNNFGYKIGEKFIALTQWQSRADGEYERQNSNEKFLEARKESLVFTTRAGFVGTEGLQDVDVDDELTYVIYRSSEYDRKFRESGSTSGNEPEARINNHDVATSISSRQRSFDENINTGSLYKAGSAVVICTDRSDPFVSDIDYDGAGTQVTATFKVIEAGKVHVWDQSTLEHQGEQFGGDDTIDVDFTAGKLCSNYSQLFQLLVGAFSVERAAKTIEVGLQSNVGLKSSGITNFNSLVAEEYYESATRNVQDGSYQAWVDAEFCGGQEDGVPNDGDTYRKEILPGTYSAADTRFSFFRILYRDIDSGNNNFIASTNIYGIRSVTGVDVYNYLRFKFSDSKRREFRFMPLASWELRSGEAAGALYAIDAHDKDEISVAENGFTLEFVGEEISDPTKEFKLKAFTPPEPKSYEICTDRDIVSRVAVVDQGSGYTNGPTGTQVYDNVLVRETTFTPDNKTLRVRITVSRPTSSVGFVSGVSVPNKPDAEKWQVNDTFRLDDETDIGGGSGFIGKIGDLGVETTCITKDGSIQLGYAPVDDGDSYVDAWARVAEAFVYDSVSTTASEPEHKISYVNIISENESTPNYDDMSIVGLNIRSSKELRALDQLSVYCEGGMTKDGLPTGDPIHLFPDVFQDLLTNDRFGTGEFFDIAQIDTASFAAANTWTEDRNYYFDGAISEKINLRTWGAERARDFLLDLSVSGGKFTLKPSLTFDAVEPVVAMYSSGNIIEDTLQVNYFDTQDRLDPIVSVRWREERRDSSIDSKGLFPQIREFNVRRAGVSENAPVIQVDLSNFCTSYDHALDRAKLECQSKRYVTHAVNFKTVPSETGIQAGSIIKLAIETVSYQQPQNGAVANNGEVTSWAPIADGSYTALIWDGNTLSTQSLSIVNGKAPAFANSVFSIETATSKAETYKVSSVSFDEDGNVDVEALYWPTNDSGISLMTLDWDNAGEWEIS